MAADALAFPVWWLDARHSYPDALGWIPTFLDLHDPRPAREQFAERYVSGWDPFHGFSFDRATLTLSYPGDPPMQPIAGTLFRDESVLVYRHAWVLVMQPDGAWECARMD